MEVRAKFDRSWARGFEIVEAVDGAGGSDGYRVRRRSDGSVLPTVFERGDVREEKRKNDMWWV